MQSIQGGNSIGRSRNSYNMTLSPCNSSGSRNYLSKPGVDGRASTASVISTFNMLGASSCTNSCTKLTAPSMSSCDHQSRLSARRQNTGSRSSVARSSVLRNSASNSRRNSMESSQGGSEGRNKIFVTRSASPSNQMSPSNKPRKSALKNSKYRHTSASSPPPPVYCRETIKSVVIQAMPNEH